MKAPIGGDVTAALRLFEVALRLSQLETHVLAKGSPPLTFRQFRLLGRIIEGHDTITQLGHVATISLPAISESVEGLVQRDLVCRTVHPADGRVATLTLTDAGEEALAIGEKLLAEAAEQLLTGIPDDRRGPLISDLITIDGHVAPLLRRRRHTT